MAEEQPMTDFYRKQARNLGCPSNQDWMSCTARGFYMLYKDRNSEDRGEKGLREFCKECKALMRGDFPRPKGKAYRSDSSEVSSEGEGCGESKKISKSRR